MTLKWPLDSIFTQMFDLLILLIIQEASINFHPKVCLCSVLFLLQIFSLVYLGLRSSLLLHPPSRIKVCDAAHLPAISTEPTLMPNESTESYVWVTQVTSRNHESNCVWQNNMAWHQSHVDYGNCPAGANSGVCGSLVTVAIVTSIFIALCFLRDGSIAYRRAQLKATKHLATDTLSFVGCTFLFLELLFTFVCAGVWLISSYLLSSGLSTILKMIDYPNCSGTTRCYSWSDGRCCIQRKYIDVVVWSQTHVYRSRTSSAPSIAWSTGVLLVSILYITVLCL